MERKPYGESAAFLYGITFVLAACSLLYELLIAQTLSWFLSNSVVWYSITVGVYLGSLGIGAALFYKKDHAQDPFKVLCGVEAFLSLVGGLSVGLIYFSRILFQFFIFNHQIPFLTPFIFHGLFLVVCFAMIITIGVLTGKEVPALIAIAQRSLGTQEAFNKIIAIDCFGSCLGGILFAIVFVPHFSLLRIAGCIAMVNAFCLLCLACFLRERFSYQRSYVAWGVLLLLGSFWIGFHDHDIEQYFLRKIYYRQQAESLFDFLRFDKDLPYVMRFRSAYQVIDIIPRYPQELDPVLRHLSESYSKKASQGKFYEKGFLLSIDGEGQFHSDIEEFYHEYFAHIPMILQKKVPAKVLVLGAGDGMLIRELLKHPGIQRIDHVDIDPVIVHLSRTRDDLLFLNEKALDHPKVHTFIQDGYHYLRNCTEKYDAIYLDFPIARDYNVNKLYTIEFYSFVQRCVADGGYMVLDVGPLRAPLGNDRLEERIRRRRDVYFNTISAAGFQTVLLYGIMLEPDNQEVKKRLGQYYRRYIQEHGGPLVFDDEMTQRQELWVSAAIERFLQSQSDGYIFAVKESRAYGLEYADLGISLRALNKERFILAFPQNESRSHILDHRKINSIMKPVLLNM